MNLDEETHWRIDILIRGLAVQTTVTFSNSDPQADVLLIIRPEDTLVRADGGTSRRRRSTEARLDWILSMFLLVIQLQRAVLQPVLPDTHDALAVLHDVGTAEEDAAAGAEADQLRVGAELAEQLVGIEVQDVRDLGRPAVAAVRVDGLAGLAGGRLRGRDARDAPEWHRCRHAGPFGPESTVQCAQFREPSFFPRAVRVQAALAFVL